MNTEPKFLHYLVVEADGKIIAHCLDYDLVAAADDDTEAIRRLGLLVRCHVETARKKNTPFALHHRAPDEYWDRFSSIQRTENLRMLALEISDSKTVEHRLGVLAASITPTQYALQ